MKSFNVRYVIATLMITTLFSCDKQLDQVNPNSQTSSSFWKTQNDAIQGVNACYQMLLEDGGYMRFSPILLNVEGDDVRSNSPWTAISNVGKFQLGTADPSGYGWSFDEFYQGILRCNQVLQNVPSINMDEGLKNRILGQAYFLRGLYFFHLVDEFGSVPLPTKANEILQQSSVPQGWDQVKSDFKAAIPLLPAKYSAAGGVDANDLGRATKGAAMAYLGKAYLFNKNFDSADAQLKAVIDLGTYSLMPSYEDNFTDANENNAESIFELQFSLPGGATPDWSYNNNEVTWMSSFMWPWETSNFGYTYSNKLLYNSFEAGDTRKAATIVGPGDTLASPGIVAIGGIRAYPQVIAGFNGKTSLPASHFTGTDGKIINTCGKVSDPWLGDQPGQLRSGYYGTKFWRDPNVSGNTPSPADGKTHIFGDQDVVMLRLGEILLSKAEAQFQSGDQAGATATLQLVRNRAWGGVAPADPYGPDFMQMMLQEYRHELSGEMSLWYDLRRTGLQIDYIKNNFGLTIPAGHDLLPIPASAIATNPTLQQNPNY